MNTITEPTLYTDPRAPWNWDMHSRAQETECPCCNGYGRIFSKRNIYTGDVVDIDFREFCTLPYSVDDALEEGMAWHQWDDVCPDCNGEGYI